MSDIRVYDKSDLRKYRTEIPNTVVKGELSKKLSVHSKFLYLYLKSVAGDNGECWQSTKTLSEGTGMAAGTVSKCKKELAKNGIIKIKKGDPKKGQSDTITITDIWGKNMIEYATDQTPSSNEHPPSSDERTPSPGEHPPSSDEPKKEPYNQERTQEEESARESEDGATSDQQAPPSKPKQIEQAATPAELAEIWFQHLKEKRRWPTLSQQEMIRHKLDRWGGKKSKKIVAIAIECGYVSLKQDYLPEEEEKEFLGRPDAVHIN